MSRVVTPACVFDEREPTGLYQGQRLCLTHHGYTIFEVCPREGEAWDLGTVEGLAHAIDPGAWPTDQQIEDASVCRVSNPYPEGRIAEEAHSYQDRQRKPLEAAERVLRLLEGGPAVKPRPARLARPNVSADDEDWSTPEGYDDSPDQGVHQFDGGGAFTWPWR